MHREIKISFQDHPILARNSNPNSDFVTLELDFHLDELGVKQKAVTLVGTQNAINAIGDNNPLVIDGTSEIIDFDTPQGIVQVTTDFGGDIELYTTYRIFSTLTDHIGWPSVNLLQRWTNFIMTHEGKPIALDDTNKNYLVFIHPSEQI